MTLCLAAEARGERLVFATDFQVEGTTARADIGMKVCEVGHEFFPVLMAGTQTRAAELSAQINSALMKSSSATGTDYTCPNWDNILHEAVLRQKNRIADELIVGKFGMRYLDFIKLERTSSPRIFFETPLQKWPGRRWIVGYWFWHSRKQVL